MKMKPFILKYASKIMFYDVNIACYQSSSLLQIQAYRHRVWKLIYLTMARLDIAYIIGLLSQFMHVPQEIH